MHGKVELQTAPPQDIVAKDLKNNNGPNPFRWLSDLVAIRQDKAPFFGTEDGYGRVTNGKDSVDVYTGDEEAVGLHSVCWELLGKPNYDSLVSHHIISQEGLSDQSPYKECTGQFYDWECFIQNDKDLWAALDPNENKQSMQRIKTIINLKTEILSPLSLVSHQIAVPIPLVSNNKCKGKTLRGIRCSRKVKQGDYCYQHQLS